MKFTFGKYKDYTYGLVHSIKVRNNFFRLLISLFLFICMSVSPAFANPIDGQVESGSATITAPDLNTVQINPTQDKVISFKAPRDLGCDVRGLRDRRVVLCGWESG